MGYVFDAINRGDRDDDHFAGHPPTPPNGPPFACDGADDGRDAHEGPSLSLSDLEKAVPPANATPFASSMAPPTFDHNDGHRESDQTAAPLTLAQPQAEAAPGNTPRRSNSDDRLVVLESPSGVIAEEYRAIRTGVLARWHHKRHLIHTITSATPQEGKTITSLNLGLSFAELHNRRTLVIEADLRLPQFRRLLGLPEGPGLVNILRGELTWKQAITRVEGTNLDIITAGPRSTADAIQLLSSNQMSALLKTLRHTYSHVIIDTPPVVELADAGILGAQSDDVLLIVRMERTPRMLVEQAIRTLESYNAPVVGMIATDRKRYHGKYYYYRYGYRYGYQYRYYTGEKRAA